MNYVLALVVVLMACVTPKSPSLRYERIVLHADPGFSPFERHQITMATQSWYDFTNGRIDIVVVYDTNGVNRIYRSKPTDLDIIKFDAQVTAARGEETRINGITIYEPYRVWLVVDRVEPWDLHLLAAHEFGHVAKMQWPGCADTVECNHSPDPTALMYPVFNGRELGPSDRAFCKAAGLCD